MQYQNINEMYASYYATQDTTNYVATNYSQYYDYNQQTPYY